MPNGNDQGRPPSEREMARLRRAHSLALERLLKIPGVHSVGIGYKRVGGEITDELAVVIFVDEKRPPSAVEPRFLIPPEVRFHWDTTDREELVRTDVVERPRAVEYPHIADDALAGRVRPVPGGRSIQGMGGGGTLGGWVWDDLNDEPVLLSNNHVLGGTAGSNVYQPWGSTAAADQIADVVRTGTLDATIAAPLNDTIPLYEIEGIGPAVYEIAEATLNMQVEKCGATTEHTTGRVVTVNLTGHYGSTNDFEVDRDVGIDRFAYYGDSGSLIVERTHPSGASWKRVVGLLWGGVPSLRNAYAHQIEDVFANLSLETVCAGIVEEIFDALFAESFAALAEPEPVHEPERMVQQTRPRGRRPLLVRWYVRPIRLLNRGFARDVERRLLKTDRGRQFVDMVHRHRVELVRLLVDREARRALFAAVTPFVRDAWTADEVFERELTDEDVVRFRRMMNIASRHQPELGDLLGAAQQLLEEAPRRRLEELLR